MPSGDCQQHNNLGTTLLRSGDVAGADSALREAIRLRPELGVTHFNLGLTLAAQGRLEEAVPCFETAL
jgi:Flp pilus assembly protein TadD